MKPANNAAFMPITWALLFVRGPPESPGRIACVRLEEPLQPLSVAAPGSAAVMPAARR